MKPYSLFSRSRGTAVYRHWKLFAGLFAFGIVWNTLQLQPRFIEGRMDPVDGDSFKIGKFGVRLDGIDAPEREQTCERNGANWPCGKAAADGLSELVRGATVTCRWRRRDVYNRLLANCWVNGLELNRWMVEHGFAISSGGYADSEARAKAAKSGIWAGTFDDPKIWREAHRPDVGS